MVQIPGTQLDTRNAGDQQAITILIDQEQLADDALPTFLTNLGNEQQHWTDYERTLYTNAAIRWARRADAGQVYAFASGRQEGRQQGVWCVGRVIVNHQAYGTATEAVRAQRTQRASESPYAQPQGVSAAELEATINDAEVLVLEDLSNILTNQDWETMQHLQVMMTGSQGPCNVCKRRIRQLISDLNRIAYTQRPDLRATRQHPSQLPLVFEVNYTTTYQPNVNQAGLPTTYGYQHAQTIVVASQQQPPTRYEFWSRVEQLFLGANNQVNFQNL